MKRTIAVLSLCLACCLGSGVISAASGPNYASSTEIAQSKTQYLGYIQIKPSFIDYTAPRGQSKHASYGRFRYYGSDNDSWCYTARSSSKTDTRVLSNSRYVMFEKYTYSDSKFTSEFYYQKIDRGNHSEYGVETPRDVE